MSATNPPIANHRYKSTFGQCECRWCGKMRNGQPCAVTNEMRVALRLFMKGNGRTWKSKLHDEWQTGGYGLGDLQQPLMQLRNVISPAQLHKLKSSMVEDLS